MQDIETAVKLGQLQERVRGLDSKFGNLETKMDAMDNTMRVGLADQARKQEAIILMFERAKGGLWVLMALASVVSSAATLIIKHLATGPTP
ncbi:MAG: hypothetical protein LW854_18975 [Rubrivivax sp.]|jgi:hypothetical protein|nr:hypothetical protein [Rubrivivax sp.]